MGKRVIAGLAWFHRWASILFCLLLALWFASGAVMLFVPFPSVSAEAKRAAGEPLEQSQVAVPPSYVIDRVRDATAVRLIQRNVQAAYVVTDAEGTLHVFDAHSGEPLPLLGEEAARRFGSRYFANVEIRRIERLVDDQWIVHQAFDAGRPWYRIDFDDAISTSIYVSAVTGELGQVTTQPQRAANAVGAVLHWVYFTPLRRHWSAWDHTVWWLSLFVMVGSVAGVVLGVIRFKQARQRSGAGFRAFRGLWRWHHILGLTAGFALIGWIFSGWLSMDHQRLFSGNEPSARFASAIRGPTLIESAAELGDHLPALGSLRELSIGALGGKSFWIARGPRQSQLSYPDGRLADALDPSEIEAAIRSALPAGVKLSRIPDSAIMGFYRRSEELSLSNIGYRIDPPNELLLVDTGTGEVSALLDGSRRAYSWLYFGLHSWLLPGVSDASILRKITMLLVLAGGFALCVTGIILAWRRIRA